MNVIEHTARIPLPETDDDRADVIDWLPKQNGHRGLTFSNGLEMAHDDASRRTEEYAKNPANHRPATYEAPDGATVRTLGGDVSEKAILAYLTAKPKRGISYPQILPRAAGHVAVTFSNGVAIGHDDASRRTDKFVRDVEAGRKTVPGMTAEFTVGTTVIAGVQKNPQKIARLMRSMT